MSKRYTKDNLRLAGVFIVIVILLITASVIFKFFLVVRESRFDATHRFIVAFLEKNGAEVVSFSPQTTSMSMLKIDSRLNANDLSTTLEVPIDGTISVGNTIVSSKNVSSILLKSALHAGYLLKDMTFIDAFRLFVFSKEVNLSSIYERELSPGLSDAQKSTLLSLSFTDPTIYQENKSIQIINAANVYGLGSRLASFITNIGGNVILVSTSDQTSDRSRIIYSGDKSYTVQKLSNFLGFPLEKSSTLGFADVTIIIGTDKLNNINY